MTYVWKADPECLGDAWEALEWDIRQRSLALATSSLQMLTYNRVGTPPVTVRFSTSTDCGCGFDPYTRNQPFLQHTYFCNLPVPKLDEIDLPGPVGYVDQIKVDGVALDLTKFRLDNGHLLVCAGRGSKPCANAPRPHQARHRA